MRSLFDLIFKPLNSALGVIPIGAARWIVAGYLLLAVLGAALLKSDFVFKGASERRWWLDLRLWTALATLPYILLYLFL